MGSSSQKIKLSDGSWISLSDLQAAYLSGNSPPIRIDTYWYMTEGPGRYIAPSHFSGIDYVLTNQMNYSAGIYQLSSNDPVNNNAIFNRADSAERQYLIASLSNYTTGILSDDWITRGYAFGSCAFVITAGTVIVAEDGSVTIRNLTIAPLDDNFNFSISGKNLIVQMYNSQWLMENDPLYKGKGVDLEFRDGEASYKKYEEINDLTKYSTDPEHLKYGKDKEKSDLSGNWGDIRESVYDRFPELQFCFARGTKILLAGGGEKFIENISIGDMVLSFRPEEDGGRGELLPKAVKQLFQGSTTEWLIIEAENDHEYFSQIVVTPGHNFLSSDGTFIAIEKILQKDSIIVSKEGRLIKIKSKKVLCDEPQLTYNFEVDDCHTYVANSFRVHNKSIMDGIPDDAYIDFSNVVLDESGVPREVGYAFSDGRYGYKIGIIGNDGATVAESERMY